MQNTCNPSRFVLLGYPGARFRWGQKSGYACISASPFHLHAVYTIRGLGEWNNRVSDTTDPHAVFPPASLISFSFSLSFFLTSNSRVTLSQRFLLFSCNAINRLYYRLNINFSVHWFIRTRICFFSISSVD